MRAIAALCVLFAHVGLVVAGTGPFVNPLAALGLDVFFLISGFLLYRPFAAARLTGRRPPTLRGFYRRRVLRIVPGYWFALVVLGAALGLAGVYSSEWWVYFGFLQAYSHEWVDRGISPAWSLGVEISFYALLPLFALAVHRMRSANRSLRGDAVLIASLGLLSATSDWLLRHLTPVADETAQLLSWTLVGNGMFFAAGMLLAIVSVATREGGASLRAVDLAVRDRGLAWAAALVLFALTTVLMRTGYYHGIVDVLRLLLLVTAALMLLPAVFAGAGPVGLPRRVLATRTLTWLGLVSYGIYIWHRPIVDRVFAEWFTGGALVGSTTVIVALIVVPLAIAGAAVSYYLVERPALRLKDRIDVRRGER